MTEDHAHQGLRPIDLLVVIVSVLALTALLLDALLVTHPEAERLLEAADLFFCAVFFLDFVRRLLGAVDRGSYLLRGGWLDLLSSIPVVGVLRIGRLARIAHVVRVLRGTRALRDIGRLLARRQGLNVFFTTALVSFTTILFGSVAILHAEQGPGTNIQTASDALWWAFVTITTVGYGDLYPVTVAGRVTAAVLMTVGVGLFGTMSGVFASWLVRREGGEAQELAALREELRAIRERLDKGAP